VRWTEGSATVNVVTPAAASVLAVSPVRPNEGILRLEREGRPYTLAELDAASDEGSEWWEADQGVLIVNAPPTRNHQRWVGALYRAWWTAAAGRWEVLTGPQRVVADENNWADPDVAVWPLEPEADPAGWTSTPVLVAEVLSPSTARRDQRIKPGLYGRAGVTWLVMADPATVAPAIVIYQLAADGSHARVASAVGDEPLWCPLTGADLTPTLIARG
jgi:Uma2 family endonuclease